MTFARRQSKNVLRDQAGECESAAGQQLFVIQLQTKLKTQQGANRRLRQSVVHMRKSLADQSSEMIEMDAAAAGAEEEEEFY